MSASTSTMLMPAPAEVIVLPHDFFWRMSVPQYHAMIDAGILTADDRVELLAGWLVAKMAKHPPHRRATRHMQKALEKILPPGWYVDTQEPITLADSEPEPDVMIARGETDNYPDRHPGPQDIALLVEVADSSLARDQEFKKWIYARAGIAVYWIVNLPENRVEVYSAPTADEVTADYQSVQHYTAADELPLLIEGREIGRIKVGDLLP